MRVPTLRDASLRDATMKLKSWGVCSSGCELVWKAVSQVMQPAQEAPDGLVAVLPIEVSGAEVTVGDAVPQDEVRTASTINESHLVCGRCGFVTRA